MKPIGPITSSPKSSVLPWVIAASAVTFTLGVSGAMFFTQSRQNSQAEMMAALTAQMMQMQQDGVTRNATPDLLTVPAATPVAAVAPVAPARVIAVPAPAEPVSDYVEVVAATPLVEFKPIDLSANSRKAAEGFDPNFDPNTVSREDTISNAISSVNQIALGVLDGEYSVVNETEADGQSHLRLEVADAGQTAANLEILLARAAANGDIALQSQVASPGGSVDPHTLLFDLVQRSLENGTAEEAAAAAELRRRAFQASAAQSEVIEGERFYTVEPGDSLAYIALQFYGSTSAYGRIFEANRSLVASPDKIQVGQRLIIPNV